MRTHQPSSAEAASHRSDSDCVMVTLSSCALLRRRAARARRTPKRARPTVGTVSSPCTGGGGGDAVDATSSTAVSMNARADATSSSVTSS